MFIHYGEPLGTFDRGPGSLPRVVERGERGRQVVKSHLCMLIIAGVVMAWIVPEISSFQVGGPSSLSWSGGAVPWYGVYGSPTVCRWTELILSRSFNRNR
jgi:hypothetical protein